MKELELRVTYEGLNPEAFEALLSILGENRLAASHKYEVLRHKLVYFFRYQGCFDPESLADVCLDRLARKISEGTKVMDLNGYTLGIARIVLLETRKKGSKQTMALREIGYQWRISRNVADDRGEILLELVKECLEGISGAHQELLKRYYGADGRSRIEQRRRLAEELGISPTALRNRALRARDLLEAAVRARLRISAHNSRDKRGKSDTYL
jgi:hypothetical protein